MIKLLIADTSVLIRRGFAALLAEVNDFSIVAESGDIEDLREKITSFKPDVLIIDNSSLLLSSAELKSIIKLSKKTKILAISNVISKHEIKNTLDAGVTSYLFKDCDKEEIIEAIYKTNLNEQFLCGKIANLLVSEPEMSITQGFVKNLSCKGISVTEREADIIKLIAEGLSNKQIADKLCLSTHTVNTHRKNIMSKLGVNNTAGLVLFAVKNYILEPNSNLFS